LATVSDVATFATDRQSFVLGTLATGTHADAKFYAKPQEFPKRYWRAVITTAGATDNLSALIAEFSIVF
jgi:hypothetical protein